jgi:hypothetical protein
MLEIVTGPYLVPRSAARIALSRFFLNLEFLGPGPGPWSPGTKLVSPGFRTLRNL